METRVPSGNLNPTLIWDPPAWWKDTFLNAYKILSLSILTLKTKETTFQILKRMTWTQNKVFKSGLSPDLTCLRCATVETMEHLLYICENYAAKTWALSGRALTLALSHHSGDYIPAITLTPLKIVYNKSHPSILLHIQDSRLGKL